MKFKITILFLIISSYCFAQFPSNPQTNNPQTNLINLGAATFNKGIVTAYYYDTAAANADTYVSGVNNIIIKCTVGGLWTRTNTSWQKVSTNVNGALVCEGLQLGGKVTYSGNGLVFNVNAALYCINDVSFSSLQGLATLSVANVSLPRIDVIALDTNQNIVVIAGVAATNPATPQINPNSQVYLTSVLVPAGATTPGGISTLLVYDENVEWTTASTTSTVNFNNTLFPYNGIKSAQVLNTTNENINFNYGSILPYNVYNTLNFRIRLTAVLRGSIYIQFSNSSVPSYILVTAAHGFNPMLINTYQNITIPCASNLNAASSISMLFGTKTNNTIYVDYVRLQGGIAQPTTQSYVTNIFKKASTDSIFQVISGVNVFAFRDSAGSASQPIVVTATGDATGTSTSSGTAPSLPLTLATVVTPATVGSSTQIPILTFDAKGRITSATSTGISGASGGTVTSFSKTDSYGLNSTVTNSASNPNYAPVIDTNLIKTALHARNDSLALINAINLKQNIVSLTTTGSGAATFTQSSGALNIPVSSGGGASIYKNVLDFGADSSGTTNNYTAFTNAIASFPANGGTLFIPYGTYLFTTGILINKPITILGDGEGSAFAVGSRTKITCATNGIDVWKITAGGVSIQKIGFEWTGGARATSGKAIYFSIDQRATSNPLDSAGQNFTLRDVSVNEFYDNVYIDNGAVWNIENCKIFSPKRYGIHIENQKNQDNGDWSISNTQIWQFIVDASPICIGVHQTGSGGGKITNTKFNGRFKYSVFDSLTNSVILLISNSSFENYRGEAIHSISTKSLIITGCEFAPYETIQGVANINIKSGKNCVIQGNSFYASPSGGTGILLDTCTNTNLCSNVFDNIGTKYTITGGSGNEICISQAPIAGYDAAIRGDFFTDRLTVVDSIKTYNGNLVLAPNGGNVLFPLNSRYVTSSGRLGINTSSPPAKISVYTTGSVDGYSLDGTNFPAITLRSSGAVIGYSPFVVTGEGGFFDDALVGDMGFRSETGNVIIGRSGASAALSVGSGVGIGIHNPVASAKMQVASTTQGAIPAPRMTTAQRNAIVSPANGLQVYDTDINKMCFYNTVGWQQLTSTAAP